MITQATTEFPAPDQKSVTEYLQLVPGDLRGLKSELTRFENSRDAFNESEVVIVSGKWTNEDIEPGPAGDPG